LSFSRWLASGRPGRTFTDSVRRSLKIIFALRKVRRVTEMCTGGFAGRFTNRFTRRFARRIIKH